MSKIGALKRFKNVKKANFGGGSARIAEDKDLMRRAVKEWNPESSFIPSDIDELGLATRPMAEEMIEHQANAKKLRSERIKSFREAENDAPKKRRTIKKADFGGKKLTIADSDDVSVIVSRDRANAREAAAKEGAVLPPPDSLWEGDKAAMRRAIAKQKKAVSAHNDRKAILESNRQKMADAAAAKTPVQEAKAGASTPSGAPATAQEAAQASAEGTGAASSAAGKAPVQEAKWNGENLANDLRSSLSAEGGYNSQWGAETEMSRPKRAQQERLGQNINNLVEQVKGASSEADAMKILESNGIKAGEGKSIHQAFGDHFTSQAKAGPSLTDKFIGYHGPGAIAAAGIGVSTLALAGKGGGYSNQELYNNSLR